MLAVEYGGLDSDLEMRRPFISFSIVQLETLFAQKSNELAALKDLLNELRHRSTHRATSLRSCVEERVKVFGDQSTSSTEQCGPLFDGEPVGGRSEESTNAPHRASRPETLPAENEQGESTPTRAASTQIAKIIPPDDRRLPRHFSGIAGPGVKGKPDAYQPLLDTDLVIDFPPDVTRVQRYVRALELLIAEMRKEGSGSRRYELENGKLVDTQAGQVIYAFPFSEEAESFEEAVVEIDFEGRRSRGQIVSISEGTLLICIDDHLGVIIRRCVLLIDNTALIEALKDRLRTGRTP